VEIMNRLGYDAMVLGPKDLSLGPKVLSQRISEAKFAILSANAVIAATGQLVAEGPYVVMDLGGLRVALVGLSGGSDLGEIAVRDPLATAQTVVPEAAQQADVVIVLSHAGPEVDQKIAETVPGITAIVSGGTGALSSAWRSSVSGTWRLHADEAKPGHAGRFLGIARLTFDAGKKVSDLNWQSFPLGTEIASDTGIAAWANQQRGD
jgi:5'-nucleotidase